MPTINTTCRYSPMLHGVATTLFTQIVTAVNLPDIDPLTGAAMYRKGDLDLTIEHAEDVRADISVQTHKLFDVLVLALGAQNTYRCPTSKLKTQVAISLDEPSLGPRPRRTNYGKRYQKIWIYSTVFLSNGMNYEEAKHNIF